MNIPIIMHQLLKKCSTYFRTVPEEKTIVQYDICWIDLIDPQLGMFICSDRISTNVRSV